MKRLWEHDLPLRQKHSGRVCRQGCPAQTTVHLRFHRSMCYGLLPVRDQRRRIEWTYSAGPRRLQNQEHEIIFLYFLLRHPERIRKYSKHCERAFESLVELLLQALLPKHFANPQSAFPRNEDGREAVKTRRLLLRWPRASILKHVTNS